MRRESLLILVLILSGCRASVMVFAEKQVDPDTKVRVEWRATQ